MNLRWIVASLLGLVSTLSLEAGSTTAYFGTYTKGGDSQGIYRASFDTETGKLGEPSLAAEIADPSFIAFAQSGDRLYAVSESQGTVTGYRILDSGDLEIINSQSSGGKATCHLSLNSDGTILALASYSDGSVASYKIDAQGALSEAVSHHQHVGSSADPRRQKGPHAHSIYFTNDDRFAYAMDLGTDRIYRYAVDRDTGALSLVGETAIKPGSGPRHLAFNPEQTFAYVINEMGLTVTAFQVKETGELVEIQTISTLPEGTEPIGSTAEILCHPSGRFLYGSNRGHDTIVVYRIDPATGQLSYVENEGIRGQEPRGFVLSSDGHWLLVAGQKSGTVAVFSINGETGELDYAGSEIKVGTPVCIRFRPEP